MLIFVGVGRKSEENEVYILMIILNGLLFINLNL